MTIYQKHILQPMPHTNVFQYSEEILVEVQHELTVLKEWENVQMQLLSQTLIATSAEESWRKKIEISIHHSTKGKAQIWWEPLSEECFRGNGQISEIWNQHVRYGVLKLVPGYLISRQVPEIPQAFAQLCSLLIMLTEYKVLLHYLLKSLSPLDVYGSLTPREKDVLQGMAFGESEEEISRRLHIATTTVRTHRHHIYQCLDVHSPHEAVLRSFALRLMDWLDLPLNDDQKDLHFSSHREDI